MLTRKLVVGEKSRDTYQNPTSGQSQGLAFVASGSRDSVDSVLNYGSHIEDKRVKVTPEIKKIFVGGIESNISKADIHYYFENYGKVKSVELPFDKIKKRRNFFCFVAFEDEMTVDQVCKQPKQRIGNKICDVKKATSKPWPVLSRGIAMASRGRGKDGYPHSKGSGGGGNNSRGGSKACFNCGEDGHMSRDCPNERKAGAGGGGGGRSGGCFNYGEDGPKERKAGSGGGGRSGGCFNCGEDGHLSRDCPNERKAGGGGKSGGCFKCLKYGHMIENCPNEAVEEDGPQNTKAATIPAISVVEHDNPQADGTACSLQAAYKRLRSSCETAALLADSAAEKALRAAEICDSNAEWANAILVSGTNAFQAEAAAKALQTGADINTKMAASLRENYSPLKAEANFLQNDANKQIPQNLFTNFLKIKK